MDEKVQSLLRECSRQLPFPIAQAVRGLEVAPPQPSVRAIKLFETAEAILQFVGTVVLVDAAEEASTSRRIEQEIRSGLRFERGSIGAFGTSVQRLLPLITDPFLAELGAAARGPGWGELLADLTELVQARNEQSHPIRFPTDVAAEKTWSRLLPTLVRVLVHLRSLAKYDLLVVDERKKLDATYYSLTVRLLTGWRDTPGWFRVKARCDFDPGDVVLVDRRRDRALLLTPFYLRQGDPARIGQSLLAYHRCERGVLEYYRSSFPDGDRVVVGAGESRLRGDDPKSFLLRAGAAANRIPLKVDLGIAEDSEHRWTRSTEMEAFRDVLEARSQAAQAAIPVEQRPVPPATHRPSPPTPSKGTAVEAPPQELYRIRWGRVISLLVLLGGIVGAIVFFASSGEDGEGKATAEQRPETKEQAIRKSLTPTALEAIEAYEQFQRALQYRDAKLYWGMFVARPDCFYNQDDWTVEDIRNGKRGSTFFTPPSKEPDDRAAQIVKVDSVSNEVVIRTLHQMPTSLEQTKEWRLFKIRKVDGAWKIAAEVGFDQNKGCDLSAYPAVTLDGWFTLGVDSAQ